VQIYPTESPHGKPQNRAAYTNYRVRTNVTHTVPYGTSFAQLTHARKPAEQLALASKTKAAIGPTMATENSNPEADNEVPPVARVFGLAVSEWVVYSFIAITAVAVIFGYMVGGERDAQAERAMATLAALTEVAENRAAMGGDLVCDNTLLDSELLANDYLTLSISQAPIDEEEESLGFGPALYVSVVEEKVSGDTWDTAKRLMDLVKEAGKEEEKEETDVSEDSVRSDAASNVAANEDNADDKDKEPKSALRKVRKTEFGEDEEYLRYYILASKGAICS
jgi:hypothetical protein